jgi:Ca2+/Na+ antiporter
MTMLNIGLTLICIGLMARANECQKNMEDSFFMVDHLTMAASVIMLIIAAISSIVKSWKKRRRLA